jgi:hypothetical protein
VNVRFRARQIHHLLTFALNKFHKRLVAKVINCAFDVQAKDVWHALEKGDPIPRGHGDHPALDEDIKEQLIV